MATKNQVDGFTNINITYNCQGQKIVVPINQLFIPLNDSNGNQLYITINGSDEPAYSFLVGDNGSNSGQSVLGDGFLRSAYVVYDLKNNQAVIRQVNYNGGAENLKEIDSNGIPSATAAPSVATWTADNDITSDYATATTQYSAHPSGQSSGNDPFGGILSEVLASKRCPDMELRDSIILRYIDGCLHYDVLVQCKGLQPTRLGKDLFTPDFPDTERYLRPKLVDI